MFEAFLNAACALRQSVLLAGQASQGVLSGVAGRILTRAARLGRDLALCVRELARFELQVSERASSSVGRVRLELVLEVAQLLQGLRRSGAGLIGFFPAQLARRAAHLL